MRTTVWPGLVGPLVCRMSVPLGSRPTSQSCPAERRLNSALRNERLHLGRQSCQIHRCSRVRQNPVQCQVHCAFRSKPPTVHQAAYICVLARREIASAAPTHGSGYPTHPSARSSWVATGLIGGPGSSVSFFPYYERLSSRKRPAAARTWSSISGASPRYVRGFPR